MPQSRQRKINKVRKRPRAASATAASQSKPDKSNTIKVGAMILVSALALSAVIYVITHRQNREGQEVITGSGLKYVDYVVGTGPSPKMGQMLTVNYTGTLENGKKFDSSLDHGRPFEFRIGTGSVIKGWDEGLMSMRVGGRRKLIVPSALGYGQRGSPPDIPANATLIFDVELLNVQ
ncbi:MAG: FKBP-type peptidyl-prolyl cis-trans isomerase [Pyrinomonadaceae bacterium]